MNKRNFIRGIREAQEYLQRNYETRDLNFLGCCKAIEIGFCEDDSSIWELQDRVKVITGNKSPLSYYLGAFTERNLFKRMMVLECLMEEMIKDGSYKKLK